KTSHNKGNSKEGVNYLLPSGNPATTFNLYDDLFFSLLWLCITWGWVVHVKLSRSIHTVFHLSLNRNRSSHCATFLATRNFAERARRFRASSSSVGKIGLRVISVKGGS